MDKVQIIKDRLAEMPGILKALENGILDGDVNPLELPIIVSCLDKWIKYVKDNEQLQDAVYSEHLRHGNKTVDIRGCKITISERASWDYTPCEDQRLISLQKEIDYLTEQKKAVEAELQARYKIDDFANPITGEIIEVVKPIKTTKTFFSVKL